MNKDKGYHQTYGADQEGRLLLVIRSPEGRAIGTVPLRSTTGSVWDGGKGIEQAKADAKMIVEALNSYAGVARLQEAGTIGGEGEETLELTR